MRKKDLVPKNVVRSQGIHVLFRQLAKTPRIYAEPHLAHCNQTLVRYSMISSQQDFPTKQNINKQQTKYHVLCYNWVHKFFSISSFFQLFFKLFYQTFFCKLKLVRSLNTCFMASHHYYPLLRIIYSPTCKV